MQRKPTDPLSGCFVLVGGSFLLLLLLLLLLKGCKPSFIDASQLSRRFAGIFTGILVWAGLFLLLGGKDK